MGVINDLPGTSDAKPGTGLNLDSEGNPDFAGKRLTEVGEPVEDDDVVTKTFLEDQFLQPNMTRNVFSKGISMQGGRIEGLPDPVTSSDATNKSYVERRLVENNGIMNAHITSEDTRIEEEIRKGDRYRHIETKDILNLHSGSFRASAEFATFSFGVARDFTRKYHNANSHVVCSLTGNSAVLFLILGQFKVGKYRIRIEGIINPDDDGSNFDVGITPVSLSKLKVTEKYKEKIDPHSIVLDVEIDTQILLPNLTLVLNIDYVPNKEIALFFMGRSGEGYVDPMMIDNINYWDKIKIPAYHSFMSGNRKKTIGITSNIPHTKLNPIENLLSDPNTFNVKDAFGHFRFTKAFKVTDSTFFELHFPCLVSMTAVIITQKTDSNHGTWMIRGFNEKSGRYDDLISGRGFQWRGNNIRVGLNDHVGMKFMFALVQGRTTPDVDINPFVFNFKESFF